MKIEDKCLIGIVSMWVLGMILGICAIKNNEEVERLKKENETLKINYNDCIIDTKQENNNGNTVR